MHADNEDGEADKADGAAKPGQVSPSSVEAQDNITAALLRGGFASTRSSRLLAPKPQQALRSPLPPTQRTARAELGRAASAEDQRSKQKSERNTGGALHARVGGAALPQRARSVTSVLLRMQEGAAAGGAGSRQRVLVSS